MTRTFRDATNRQEGNELGYKTDTAKLSEILSSSEILHGKS